MDFLFSYWSIRKINYILPHCSTNHYNYSWPLTTLQLLLYLVISKNPQPHTHRHTCTHIYSLTHIHTHKQPFNNRYFRLHITEKSWLYSIIFKIKIRNKHSQALILIIDYSKVSILWPSVFLVVRLSYMGLCQQSDSRSSPKWWVIHIFYIYVSIWPILLNSQWLKSELVNAYFWF